MPTKPNLGEFVEKKGKLYFIKKENLAAGGQSGRRAGGVWAYLLGYSLAVACSALLLCVVVLFPLPLFALLIVVVVLNAPVRHA